MTLAETYLTDCSIPPAASSDVRWRAGYLAQVLGHEDLVAQIKH
jgi:hypothetical protein